MKTTINDQEIMQMEAFLKTFQPAPITVHLMDRLERAVAKEDIIEEDEELAAEDWIRHSCQPAALSRELSQILERSIASSPFMIHPKASYLPVAKIQVQPIRKKRFSWKKISSVAAVIAIISGAWMMYKQPSQQVLASRAETLPMKAPVSYQRQLKDISDEGVIWNQGAQRIFKVIYQDQLNIDQGQNQKVEYENPHVEYIVMNENFQ